MIDKLKLIQKTVERAKSLPNATIDYNFSELPRHKEIKNESFFGVKAEYNPKRQINTLNVIRKF